MHIRGIVQALEELGCEIVLISPPGISLGNSENCQQKSPSLATKFWSFISRSFPEIGFKLLEIAYNAVSYRKIKKEIQQNTIDLIYERYALFNLSGVWLAKKFGVPIILEVNIVSTLEDVRQLKLKRLTKKFEDIILEQADAIIVVSTFLKNHLIERSVTEDKIWVLPNATNPFQFRSKGNRDVIRENLNINDKFVIGFVGRLLPWYKLEMLLEVLKNLVALNQKQACLLLIGEGVLRPKLQNLIQEYHLERNVVMTGWIAHSEICDYIDAMDIAVLPNSNQWGSPMKIFEYMSMEKPVIAPSYPPISEIITSGENGLLFQPGNSEQLKNAIVTLMIDEKLRKQIGANARKTVVDNHTWRKNGEKILEIYSNLNPKSNYQKICERFSYYEKTVKCTDCYEPIS